jgi:hypothetical protein
MRRSRSGLAARISYSLLGTYVNTITITPKHRTHLTPSNTRAQGLLTLSSVSRGRLGDSDHDRWSVVSSLLICPVLTLTHR